MEKSNMNILLLCSYESTYVTQLWENIKKCCPGIRLSLLTKSSAENYILVLLGGGKRFVS